MHVQREEKQPYADVEEMLQTAVDASPADAHVLAAYASVRA
jgi:hypothetical protein